MTDIEFPLREELRGKNLQKIIFNRDLNQIYVFINRKATVIEVDIYSMQKTAQNFERAFNGQADSTTKEYVWENILDGLAPYINENAKGHKKINEVKGKLGQQTKEELNQCINENLSRIECHQYRVQEEARYEEWFTELKNKSEYF